MSRIYRNFESPNSPSELLLAPSPWHFEGLVLIPDESWLFIESVGTTVDANLMEEFTRLAGKIESETGILLKKNKLEQFVNFFDNLIEKIRNDKILDKFSREGLQDDFSDEGYIDMILAVIAVLNSSKQTKKPFRMWFD